VDSQEFREAPELLNQALVNMRDLTAKLNEEVTPLTRSLRQTSDEAGAAMADLRFMMRTQDGEEVVRLAASIEAAANQAESLLNQSKGVVSSVQCPGVTCAGTVPGRPFDPRVCRLPGQASRSVAPGQESIGKPCSSRHKD